MSSNISRRFLSTTDVRKRHFRNKGIQRCERIEVEREAACGAVIPRVKAEKNVSHDYN
jgi:hypothetical protein